MKKQEIKKLTFRSTEAVTTVHDEADDRVKDTKEGGKLDVNSKSTDSGKA